MNCLPFIIDNGIFNTIYFLCVMLHPEDG